MSDDPAYALFPSDVPKSTTPPDWYNVKRDAAEARLTGRHAATQDDAAARMFPSEARKADQPSPAGKEGDDPERALFKNDAAQFDEKPVKDFVSGFAASAATDGDHERAKALEAAGEALVEDFKAAGSDAKEVAEAFDIIRMRQADSCRPGFGRKAPGRIRFYLARWRAWRQHVRAMMKI